MNKEATLNSNAGKRRLIKLMPYLLIVLCGIMVTPLDTKAQVTVMSDYLVFGGDQLCPNGPGQTDPGSSGLGTNCRVHIGAGSVINGNVGSYHFVEANGGVTINGNIYSGGRVNLANGNKVVKVTAANGDNEADPIFNTGSSLLLSGDIIVNGKVNINGGSVLGNVLVPFLPADYPATNPVPGGTLQANGGPIGSPPLPVLPVMPPITDISDSCDKAALSAEHIVSGNFVIDPGVHGDIISNNGPLTVTFNGPGDYYFSRIAMGQGGTHTFIFDYSNAVPGGINIYICGDVHTGTLATQFIGATSQDSCNVYWETHGTGAQNGGIYSFIIETGSHFYGKVWAPYAGILVGSGGCCTYVTGNLWTATYANIQHGVTINGCESCTGSLKITKVVDGEIPATDWYYTSTIPGVPDFTIPAAGGDTTFLGITPGNYTVTETNKDIPNTNPVRQYEVSNTCGTGTVANITQVACEERECIFTNYCRARLKIKKFFNNIIPAKNPLLPWSFTIDPAINGVSQFTIPIGGGEQVFENVTPGIYTITEALQVDPSCAAGLTYTVSNTCGLNNVAVIEIEGCEDDSCTFVNTPPDCNENDCQWCNKGAVLSQVWQNPGNMDPTKSCLVPDILVDVTMAHGGANDVVDASELFTGLPATWSIQAAIDYVNTNGEPFNGANPKNNEIFIGVTATQPVPADPGLPTSCGKSCVRPYAGDNPFGVENVIVENKNAARLNIFGCSVTMKPSNVNAPVFTILDGIGKVTMLDLHVKGTGVANVQGYLVKGGTDANASLVVLKNARAIGFDIGYEVRDTDVEITGSAEISGGRYGVWINGGSNVKLRTNNQVWDNSIAGIYIQGNNNEVNGNDVGAPGHPNGVGIKVAGNTNNIHDCDIYSNTSHGVDIVGNTNIVKNNDIGEKNKGNGGDGIHVVGIENLMEANDVFSNGGDGIDIAGGTAAKPNKLIKNVCGDGDKGNGANGILVAGLGNGTSSPIELDQNTTQANVNDGIKITGTGHQLKNNVSGGSGSDNNGDCEFNVVAGNFNATGNKANGVTVLPNTNGAAFPNLCQGSPKTLPGFDPMVKGFEVYPNPSRGKATVDFMSRSNSTFNIEIVDAAGKTVLTKHFEALKGPNTFDLNFDRLAKGVYMLKLQSGKEVHQRKIVVQ
jgi:hypothetical protein